MQDICPQSVVPRSMPILVCESASKGNIAMFVTHVVGACKPSNKRLTKKQIYDHPMYSLGIWSDWPYLNLCVQIAKFMGPTWGPPGSCRPQMGPLLAPWILLSGWVIVVKVTAVSLTAGFRRVTANGAYEINLKELDKINQYPNPTNTHSVHNHWGVWYTSRSQNTYWISRLSWCQIQRRWWHRRFSSCKQPVSPQSGHKVGIMTTVDFSVQALVLYPFTTNYRICIVHFRWEHMVCLMTYVHRFVILDLVDM